MSCCFDENGPNKKIFPFIRQLGAQFLWRQEGGKKIKNHPQNHLPHIGENNNNTRLSSRRRAKNGGSFVVVVVLPCVRARVDVDDGFFFLEEERGLSI
jgi:hypothetical protein